MGSLLHITGGTIEYFEPVLIMGRVCIWICLSNMRLFQISVAHIEKAHIQLFTPTPINIH